MQRRHFNLTTALLAAGLPAAAQTPPSTTLRLSADDRFTPPDPTLVSDADTNGLQALLYDAPLRYDQLARKLVLKPRTAEALPTVSADGRTWTLKIRRGIFFPDDPVWKGKPRELTAADYLYGLQRMKEARATGTAAQWLRQMGVTDIAAPDSHTLRITLKDPRPEFVYGMVGQPFYAIPREALEAYGERFFERPLSTAAYRLREWVPASRVLLERNPQYRDERYDEQPEAGDAEAQAWARQLKGRRLPLADRISLQVIAEEQPQWLSFLNGELDVIGIPSAFVSQALVGGKPAPALAAKGIRITSYPGPGVRWLAFGMGHPVIGGLAPERVALRRAIAMSIDRAAALAGVWSGQGQLTDTLVLQGMVGSDPAYRGPALAHDAARARATLDAFGWKDRNGDGWREQPDGKPLRVELAVTPGQFGRTLGEFVKRSLDAIGVALDVRAMPYPDLAKAAQASQLMMFGQGWGESFPGNLYATLAGGAPGSSANPTQFDHPKYNELFAKQLVLPFGPERTAIWREMDRLIAAYQPLLLMSQRLVHVAVQAHVVGAVPSQRYPDFAWIGGGSPSR